MKKSKQAKAKEISQETKQVVMERQHYRSISGVALSPYNVEFHHVIFKGDQGIGQEWNICAITKEEHRLFHDHNDICVNGRKRYSWLEFDILMKNHLKLWYEGWSEDACKYKKYKEFWEYGVTRREHKI